MNLGIPQRHRYMEHLCVLVLSKLEVAPFPKELHFKNLKLKNR